MLAYSHATHPARGEVTSGDAAVIREEADVVMIAVVDVLGHGPEAAKVADLAVAYLREAPIGRARDAITALHVALRGTRGAAASVCVLRGHRIDGCGVGNVEIRVLGSNVPTLLTPGILGHRTHTLREFDATLADGDRLVCFSDGISSRVPLGELRRLSPRETCEVIMREHRRLHDDATIVIADLRATPAKERS